MAWYSIILIVVAVLSTLLSLFLFLFFAPFIRKMNDKNLLNVLVKYRFVSSTRNEDVAKVAARLSTISQKGRFLLRGIDFFAFFLLLLFIVYRDEKTLIVFGFILAFSVMTQASFFILRIMSCRLKALTDVYK